MATRTVVCPECDAPLDHGRFACPACGALLATVASGSRPLVPVEEPDIDPAFGVEAHVEPVAEAEPVEPVPAEPQPEAYERVDGAMSRIGPEAADPAEPAEPQVLADPAGRGTEPAREPVEAAASASPIDAIAPAWPPPANSSGPAGASWPERPAWPPSFLTNGGGAMPAAAAVGGTAAPATAAHPLRNPAGAYLPPSAVLPPAEALPLPSAAAAVASPRKAPSALAESMGSLALPSDPAGAVIAVGAGVSAAGFLLPWADVVLGSTGMGSFLDRWGLAGPGHVVVFGVLLGLVGLAAFRHRLPRAIGPGLPALGLGFLLVGLAWPYLFGPFGATVGVYVVTAGGLLLVLAGAVDLFVRRHAVSTASV